MGVILLALILMGLFVNPQKQQGAILLFMIIGGVTAVVVLLNSFSDYAWWTGSFWAENMPIIIAGMVIIALVIVAIGPKKGSEGKFFKVVDGA